MFLLHDLDAADTLAHAEALVVRRREVELEDLRVVAHWAGLHASDPRRGPGGQRRWVGEDQLIQVGGEGTPRVQELCLAELAIARQIHPLSMRRQLADVLDLQHRLPQVWAQVVALEAELWVARKVASMSRELDVAVVGVVDDAVAAAIAGQAPSRVLEIAQAKVIEADVAGHAAKLEIERRRRFVGLGRADEFGLRHVIARVEAGDAVWVDAILERVADLLAERPDLRPDTPAQVGRQELRSVAFGWLARPEELLQLLRGEGGEGADSDGGASTRRPGLRRRAVLYLHLHEAALTGAASGVARVEELGPLLLAQVRRLVGHAEVVVKPVIDLHDQVSVNSYEFPEAIKERIHLRCPGEVFPHAGRLSRKVDIDHVVPFDPHGPPGQTGTHNGAPLSRAHHRVKTHRGHRVEQLPTGEFVWRTPHGLIRIVDHRGTTPVDVTEAAALTGDDPVDRALARLLHRCRFGVV